MSCGADDLAVDLIQNMTTGMNFDIPEVDLSPEELSLPVGPGGLLNEVLKPLDIAELTTKKVDGTGSFDVIMSALTAHLEREYGKGRITGAEYTKAYIANTQLALQAAVSWQTNREQIYWSSLTAQAAVLQGNVQLKVAAAQLAEARVRAQTAKAEYVLTSLRAANEDAQYCNNLLQGDILRFNLDSMLPMQLLLTSEQMEAARAQTADNRTNGNLVSGSIQAQKDLYRQQIISYQRSSQLNAARVFTDSWISVKAVDEGIDNPGALASANVSDVLTRLRADNNLI